MESLVGGRPIHILNKVLNYFYLGLLLTCFILSLGNRPQGAKWGYTLAFIGFGLITIYMTTAAMYLAVKGIQNAVEEEGGTLEFTDMFSNKIFGGIVVSLLSTLGLYVLASLIFVSGLRFLLVKSIGRWDGIVRTVAYDHIFYTISTHGAVIYCCIERVCCKSSPLPFNPFLPSHVSFLVV